MIRRHVDFEYTVRIERALCDRDRVDRLLLSAFRRCGRKGKEPGELLLLVDALWGHTKEHYKTETA